MAFANIQSVQNPRVKNLVRLGDARHRRRQERFLIEGRREVTRALECSWPLETVFFCPERFKAPAQNELDALTVVERAEDKGAEVVQLSPEAFDKVCYREGPDGLLAVAISQERPLADLQARLAGLDHPALVLVAEAVEKPGNLGALLRTADAAGVDAVVVCDSRTDLFNPNAIRASQGAIFSLPCYLAETRDLRPLLREAGIVPVATTPRAEKTIWEQDLRQPIALVLGAEDIGLSEDWLDGQTLTAKLPMRGVTDSLNVSVAAALVIFEAVRQRSV
ncbi:MAG: RNA methyltransferase [Verrucomicrobiota bacterium JB022]|nr:RNA methyltransferase [Verrucomicrobiota bacterium JB022]